jgi:hypothetical protein
MRMKMPFVDVSTAIRKASYGERLRPERDWLLLLAGAGLLLVASIVWNLWLFRSVGEGAVIGAGAAPAAFDATPIQSVRAVFDSRAREEARYAGDLHFVDPSR